MGVTDVDKVERRAKPSNPAMDSAWRTLVYGNNLRVLGQAVSEARSVGRRYGKDLPLWGNISDYLGEAPMFLLTRSSWP